MGIYVAHYQDEHRLDVTVEDNLDLTLTQSFMEASRFVDEQLETCVIDCTRVRRVFDSGLALLLMLVEKLNKFRVRLILLGESTSHLQEFLQFRGNTGLSDSGNPRFS